MKHTPAPAATPAPALDAPRPRPPLWRRAAVGLAKAVLPFLILVGAVLAAREIVLTAPEATRAAPERAARLVEVARVAPAARGPLIEAWGTVEPARTLAVRAEVGGRVEAVHPELTPGGLVAEGEELIRLADEEIALDIAEAEAAIGEIRARIRIEQGQQQRARRDLERSPLRNLTEEQRDLILREPQMEELQSQLDAAIARRDAARLRQEKTRIAAPFDAVVRSEDVEVGTVLQPGTEAARLAGTDLYRVVLAVPPEALDWIDADGGQTVTLTQPGVWPEGASREGRIERLRPGLTETGRMAEIVVAVEDPLNRQDGAGPRLLIGSFLRAEIEGRAVAGAVRLDRAWLREGDSVWVMTADGTLEIREVKVAWKGADRVLVSGGLAGGERIVTTRLATVAEGMALRTRDGEGAGGPRACAARAQSPGWRPTRSRPTC